jgi:SAM-dependent methyltransferase
LDHGCSWKRFFLLQFVPTTGLLRYSGIADHPKTTRVLPTLHTCWPCSSQAGRQLTEPVQYGQPLFDVALAIDSFPCVVAAGGDLVQALVRDIARVLRPNGLFLVINYSYRDDPGADDRDVAELAAAHGFDVVRHGTRDFALWDARTYLLRLPH